ncbi:MAG: hypothetical protein JO061_22790 [Acidobacteriaceae bacterium]|nr:hypothetical protein [Acidobacteriaceae bacterium]
MRCFSVLISVLSLLGATAACSKTSTKGVEIDSKLGRYVPANTTVLAGAAVQQITASAFYKRHENQLNLSVLNTASERLGLDPRRDITQILIAWEGDNPLFLATGHFSSSQLGPKLASSGDSKFTYRGQTLFGDANQAVYFPKQNIAVAGPVTALHRFIDTGRGGVPDSLAPRFDALPKADQVWLVSSQGIPMDRVPLRSDAASALSNIAGYVTAASVGVGFDDGAHLHADLVCLSPEGAKRVHDALRGMIGMARLMTRDNQMDMMRIYDAIKVDQDQQNVLVHADLSPEQADKLLAMLPAVNGRAEQLLNR